jgi:hypothetical protein
MASVQLQAAGSRLKSSTQHSIALDVDSERKLQSLKELDRKVLRILASDSVIFRQAIHYGLEWLMHVRSNPELIEKAQSTLIQAAGRTERNKYIITR